jgi:hypothetical protein
MPPGQTKCIASCCRRRKAAKGNTGSNRSAATTVTDDEETVQPSHSPNEQDKGSEKASRRMNRESVDRPATENHGRILGLMENAGFCFFSDNDIDQAPPERTFVHPGF